MNYKLEKANGNDIFKLVDYKLRNILEYARNLSNDEMVRIKDYVLNHVPTQLENYKIIYLNNEKIGCLLVESKDDGALLDKIYLEEKYRNLGIGTDIIKEIISRNEIVYLWVYKLNKRAVSLYKRLGFKIIEETETRYFMKYNN